MTTPIKTKTEKFIEDSRNQRMSLLDQDTRFKLAMLAARKAGLENFTFG